MTDGDPAVKPLEEKMVLFGFFFLTSTLVTALYLS